MSGSQMFLPVTEQPENFLYTIEMKVGTPGVVSNFLIDINTATTVVFSTEIKIETDNIVYNSYAQVDGFYNPAKSTTADHKAFALDQTYLVNGFNLVGKLYQDQICFGDSNDTCWYAAFMNTNSMRANYYLNMFDLSTIGGILGLGNSMYTSDQQIWYSGLFKTRQFSVQLVPSQADWGWIPGAEEPWDTKTSQLFVGGMSPALTSVY